MTFTSTDAEAVATELSEAARTATFSPGSEKARSEAAKLDVPRIGVRFRMPLAMRQVEYYGRGPGENYADRNAGAFVGLYSTSADEMYFPYVRPQENGHRTDTRRVRFGKRHGLEIVADSLFGFNALRNAVEDFDGEEAVRRPYQWRNLTPADKEHDEAARPQRQTPADAYRRHHTPRLRGGLHRHEAAGSGRIRQLGSHARTAAQNPRGQHVQLGIRHHSVLMQSMK